MDRNHATEISVQDLASGSLELWTEWLKGAVSAFYASTSVDNRIEAFSPLLVHPLSEAPAGDIARQLGQIGRNAVRVGPKASVELLRSWSLGRDGLEGALLLIELSIQMGSLGLYPALTKLLDQAAILSSKPQLEIAFLVAEAASRDRFKRTEIAGLLQRLNRLEAVAPTTIADLAVAFTAGDIENLESLPSDLLEILPNLPDSSFEGDVTNAIARKLQFRFQEVELRLALNTHDTDSSDAASLRRKLYCGVFPFDMSEEEEYFAVEEGTVREFEKRTGVSVSQGSIIPDTKTSKTPKGNAR